MDVFYRLTKDHISIMRDCVAKSLKIFIEQHDDYKVRTKSTKTLEEVLEIFAKNKMHWVFIKRHVDYQCHSHCDNLVDYFEVGGCTLSYHDDSGHDVFLFVYMTIEDGEQIRAKYDLTS